MRITTLLTLSALLFGAATAAQNTRPLGDANEREIQPGALQGRMANESETETLSLRRGAVHRHDLP